MKAALRRKYGLADQITIEDVEHPKCNDKEVIIKVLATTVNRTDCAILTGQPFIMRILLGLSRPGKHVLGTDFAGTVVEIGKEVKTLKIGDRVFGFNDAGLESHAEYIRSVEENVFPIPGKIDYKTAAASLEGANYAHSFVKKTNIQSGQKVFINGATGAIGSALLQFVRQYDVDISASCKTENMDLIKSLGADMVYDYTKVDFTDIKIEYDFIFDAVGKSSFEKCKLILKKKGIYISSELGPYGKNLLRSLTSFLYKKKVIFPVPYSTHETIPYITNLINNGKFDPVIDRVYSFVNIADAYSYVLSGDKIGNVLLDLESK